MITQIHLTKDMINLQESGFYSGCINPVLHEDVAVVYIDIRHRKLIKYGKNTIHITRPRGLIYALRFTYADEAHGRNAPNAMRKDVSINILNSVIRAIEIKLKEIYYVESNRISKEMVV